MLEKIEDLPENVIGFTIHGALTGNDFANTMRPALEESTAENGIELLLVTAEDFLGTDVDSAIGNQHFRSGEPMKFNKIALVTHNKGFAQAVYIFAMLAHSEVKVFEPDMEHREETTDRAITWLEK